MSRLPKFDSSCLSDPQNHIYQNIISGPRGKFGGPFFALIHAPDIADQVQSLGAALRFNTKLNAKYREIAILTAARFWLSEVEWNAHVVIALKEGVTEACIHGILHGELDDTVDVTEAAIYRFSIELLTEKKNSALVYDATVALIGVEQVVELVSILGYFGLLAMLLNTFEIPPNPIDGVPPQALFLSNFISPA